MILSKNHSTVFPLKEERSNKILSIQINRLKLFEHDLFPCLIKKKIKKVYVFYFLKHFSLFLEINWEIITSFHEQI